MKTHVSGDTCPGCDKKLEQAHKDLVEWFNTKVKPDYPDCHISWSYRDKASQNEAVALGKSKLAYPLSAHNKYDADGKPESRALDLFQLCSNGMAAWSWRYFKNIADAAKADADNIIWGGDWSSFGDSNHFELKPSK